MMAKYYLHLQTEPNLMVSLRVYERDPRKFGGAGSIEAVKMINYDTGQLDPAKVRFNVGFSNKDGYGYTPNEVDGIVEWVEMAKEIAVGLDVWVKDVSDLGRVALKPWTDFDVFYFEKIDEQIVIRYPAALAENVRPVEAGQ